MGKASAAVEDGEKIGFGFAMPICFNRFAKSGVTESKPEESAAESVWVT